MTFDGTHSSIPFTGLHKAKFYVGTRAFLTVNGGVVAPEGIGDVWLTDDALIGPELYVSRDGLTWELASAANAASGVYIGTKWATNSGHTFLGDDTPGYLTWDTSSWSFADPLTANDFGTPGSLILQPKAGIYEIHVHLLLANSAAGRWHVELWHDDIHLADTHSMQADGTGAPLELRFSTQFIATQAQPTSGAWFYLYASQNTGSDIDVLAGSNIVAQWIADTPT